MSVTDLPTLNATLNFCASICLVIGFVAVKRGHVSLHKKAMALALTFSAVFLGFYLVYHHYVGSVPYPKHDWTRPVYFTILIPHVIMAALMVPFIIVAVWRAIQGEIEKHRKIVRWLWPVWMYVSVSGVLVYLMLYRL